MSLFKSSLKDHQEEDIRRLRVKYPELSRYLDHEIAYCFHLYCEMFHAAGWTVVVDDEFIEWASRSPLDNMIDRLASERKKDEQD